MTCGNVDDGKSTLIGRLLYDSKLIYEDQLQAVTRDSKKVGTTGDAPDLALLVDGLQAEREQGITIDVAYRYFSTENVSLLLLIHRAMNNTLVTWQQVHRLLILQSSQSMRAMVYKLKLVVIRLLRVCLELKYCCCH